MNHLCHTWQVLLKKSGERVNSDLDNIDFLAQIGAANDESEYIRPTVAGLLMFGTEQRISQVYPDYFLDYQEHMDETPLHDAVREALVNCLVNTDFYQPWNVIIEKYPDKIVMANPGTIICGKSNP